MSLYSIWVRHRFTEEETFGELEKMVSRTRVLNFYHVTATFCRVNVTHGSRSDGKSDLFMVLYYLSKSMFRLGSLMARVCFPMSSKVNHVVAYQVIHGDSKVNFLFFLYLLHVKFRDPIIALHVLNSISCYNFLPIIILTPLAELRLSSRTRIKYLPYSKITYNIYFHFVLDYHFPRFCEGYYGRIKRRY